MLQPVTVLVMRRRFYVIMRALAAVRLSACRRAVQRRNVFVSVIIVTLAASSASEEISSRRSTALWRDKFLIHNSTQGADAQLHLSHLLQWRRVSIGQHRLLLKCIPDVEVRHCYLTLWCQKTCADEDSTLRCIVSFTRSAMALFRVFCDSP